MYIFNSKAIIYILLLFEQVTSIKCSVLLGQDTACVLGGLTLIGVLLWLMV